MTRLMTWMSDRRFQVAACVLLIVLICLSLPYPGALDYNRDYRWLAARAFGQSESIMRLLGQFGDLYDYNIDVSYDTLAFSQQPLNPFFLLAHFTNPFLGNYLTIMFMSVLSFFYCRRIAKDHDLLGVFPVLAAAFFLSQSFDHHFTSNLGLNSLFAVPVYYVITANLLKGKRPGLLDWTVMILGPLIMDLHAPLVLSFTVLFTIIVRHKTFAASAWTRRTLLTVVGILAVHALGWLPWLSSSSARPDVSWHDLLNFKNIFVSGPNSLHELLRDNNGYRGVFLPAVGSGTFFYMAAGFIFITFFFVIMRDRAHVLSRGIYGFCYALIAFAFFISSQYVYDILQPLSYFRFPLNIIPPLFLIASLAAIYNTKPSIFVAIVYLGALAIDVFMPHRDMNDPYVFLHYALAGIVMWAGCNRDRPTTPGIMLVIAVLYCVLMMATVLPNAPKFEGAAVKKSTYRQDSLAGMQCLEDATGDKPFTSILFTGVSENDPGRGRLFSDDTSYLVEDSRGYNLTTFFPYREFMDDGQIRTQKALFGMGERTGLMPPEMARLPSVSALQTAGIHYLGIMGKDWASQGWWKKNKGAFIFISSCQLAYARMDVYALKPQKADYTLTREGAQQWKIEAKKDMSVIVPIANRPTTRVYVNGVQTSALDASGPVTVAVKKGSSVITIANTNIKHIMAYAYFWAAMVAVAALAYLGVRKILPRQS